MELADDDVAPMLPLHLPLPRPSQTSMSTSSCASLPCSSLSETEGEGEVSGVSDTGRSSSHGLHTIATSPCTDGE